MGEIADAMLGGEMCAGCGEWLECMTKDEEIKDPCSDMGIPVYCSKQCATDHGAKGQYVCPH